jgi:hypothetical protein
MKADKIIDTIIQYMERNNIVTDETLLRRVQLFDIFCASRAKVLSDFRIRRLEISGANYMKSVIDNEVYEQGGKFNYFEVAPAVMNEYEYVGGIDGCSRFRENLTISQFQSTINCQVPSVVLYYKEENHLKIDNNSVETILTNYIPVNPMQVPTYNFEYDEFPMDEALMNTVLDTMFETYQSKTAQTPKDTVSDSQDTTKSIVQ